MNIHNESKNKNRQYGTLVFLVSLIISFCILGCCFLIFLTYVNKTVDQKQNDVPYESPAITQYQPSKSENMALLMLCCEFPQDPPQAALLFYYNAPCSSLSIIAMPTQTICTNVNGRRDTIVGHYDYEGLAGACQAVESLFSIECDKYLRLQKAGISNITDFLGGLPYIIKEDKIINGEKILKGEQMLDGRRFCAMLFEPVISEQIPANAVVTSPVSQQELIKKLFLRSFTKDFADKYESLSTAIFFNGETNLSQSDFGQRKTGFTSSLLKNSLKINAYSLKGRYSSDYSEFMANSESLKDAATFLY